MRPFFAGVALVLLLAAALRAALACASVESLPWPATVPRHPDHSLSLEAPPEGTWTLVVGGSAIDEAFDLAAAGFPATEQHLSRGLPTDVAQLLSWTLRRLPTSRRPSCVLLGLNRASFADRGSIDPAGLTLVDAGFPDWALRKRVGLDARFASPKRPREERLSYGLNRLDPWFAARDVVGGLTSCALRGALFGEPVLPPPAPQAHESGAEPDLRRSRIAEWRKLGVYAAGAMDPPQVAAAKEIPAICRDAQVPLLVASLPEHSESRALYVPGARAEFDALVRSLGRPVLDLFAAIPDEGFRDMAHVNEVGRPIATRALAKFVEDNRTARAPK